MQRPKVVHPFGTPIFTKSSDSPTYANPSADRAELDWLFAPKVAISLADRVLARLIQLEAHEPNIHLKSDYRQAFVCLAWALRGNTEPFTLASYTVHGCHPDKVWPRRVAERQAKLGQEYPDWFDAAGNLRPDIPKKPSSADDESPTYRAPRIGVTVAASADSDSAAPQTILADTGAGTHTPIAPAPVLPFTKKAGIA